MFNYNDSPFKKHSTVAEETVDDTTQAMYKSAKDTLYMIGGRMDILRPAQKRYVNVLREFCDGYEAGIIKHWYNFFMSPKKYVDYAAKKPVGWLPYGKDEQDENSPF